MTVQHLGAHVPSIRASHPSNSMRVVAPRAAVVAHSPASRRVTSPTACAGLVSSSSCPSRVLLTSTRTSIHAHQNRPERCVTHFAPDGGSGCVRTGEALSAPDAEGTVHTRRPHHQSPHPRNPPTTRSAPPLTSHAAASLWSWPCCGRVSHPATGIACWCANSHTTPASSARLPSTTSRAMHSRSPRLRAT